MTVDVTGGAPERLVVDGSVEVHIVTVSDPSPPTVTVYEGLTAGPPGPPGPAGPPGPPGPAGPAGPPGPASSKVGAWNWSTNTAAPPSNGQLRSNTGDWVQAAALFIADHTSDNVDVTLTLPTLTKQGDEIELQQKTDASRWAKYEVTAAPVVRASYLEVPVAYETGGGVMPGTTELKVAFIPRSNVVGGA